MLTLSSTATIKPINESDLEGIWKGINTIAIDAEWYWFLISFIKNNIGLEQFAKKASFISKQFYWKEKGKHYGLYILDKKFPVPDWNKVDFSAFPECEIYFLHADANAWNALYMMAEKCVANILMYYAPKDVEALVGQEVWADWLLYDERKMKHKGYGKNTRKVNKKRKTNGRIELPNGTKINLFDVIGTANNGQGLDSFLEGMGCDNPYKSLSDDWDKSRMEIPAREQPERFFEYAMGDVMFLEEAMENRVQRVNQILKEALGLEELFIVPWKEPKDDEIRFPMSSGALVSCTFERWLSKNYGDILEELLSLATCETSDIAKHYHQSLMRVRSGLEPYRTSLRKGTVREYNRKLPLDFLPTEGVHHPMSWASIPNIGHLHQGSTGLYNALVYGGRCINEHPTAKTMTIKNVLDADLNSCYGTSLVDLTFPLGFPTTLKYETDQESQWITLGEFLEQYEDDLVDGLYQIYVDGVLPFEQDLIFSKVKCSESSIMRDIKNPDGVENEYGEDGNDDTEESLIEKEHITARMVMFKREIINGLINSDMLKTIRKVSADKELNRWMKLRVKTATWYPKSTRFENREAFLQHIRQQDITKQNRETLTGWFPVPMSEFVGALVKQRKAYKRELKELKNDLDGIKNDERIKSIKAKISFTDSLQDGLKLFINTVYGCFAAPFFNMGNTVLANNITAKARLGSWMMAKALGSMQSITDGGMYSFDSVRYIKPGAKLPGFNSMSNYTKLSKHRNVRIAALDVAVLGEKITSFESLKDVLHHGTQNQKDDFDVQVLNHVNTFWKPFGLTLPFTIEHKYENTGEVASYGGAGDYCIFGVKPFDKCKHWAKKEGEYYTLRLPKEGGSIPILVKTRGAKDPLHPKKLRLLSLVTKEWYWLDYDDVGQLIQPSFIENKSIQIGDFQANAEKYLACGLMPGDDIGHLRMLRVKDTHIRVETYEEWDARDKHYSRKTREHEKHLKEDVESKQPLTPYDRDSRTGLDPLTLEVRKNSR